MINLMPEELKKQMKAARLNTILVNFLVIMFFAIIFLVFTCISTYLILNNIEQKAKGGSVITPYTLAKSKVDDIKTQISGAEYMLSNYVPYSSVLTKIGSVLPSGVIIDSISLNNDAFNSKINLKLNAKSSDITQQLTDRFTSPIFSEPNLINTNADSQNAFGYPVEVNISVRINKAQLYE